MRSLLIGGWLGLAALLTAGCVAEAPPEAQAGSEADEAANADAPGTSLSEAEQKLREAMEALAQAQTERQQAETMLAEARELMTKVETARQTLEDARRAREAARTAAAEVKVARVAIESVLEKLRAAQVAAENAVTGPDIVPASAEIAEEEFPAPEASSPPNVLKDAQDFQIEPIRRDDKTGTAPKSGFTEDAAPTVEEAPAAEEPAAEEAAFKAS